MADVPAGMAQAVLNMIDRWCWLRAEKIIELRTRDARRAALDVVPDHLRDQVQATATKMFHKKS